MFEDIGFDPIDNVTFFYTPEYMGEEFTIDVIDRCIAWNECIDYAYGYMFEELERKLF